jgi:hypothetical protein
MNTVPDATNLAALLDGHMHELPAGPVALTGAAAGEAMSRPVETGKLLDVEVQQLARARTLVALNDACRLKRCEPLKAKSPQLGGHGGQRHVVVLSNLRTTPALLARPENLSPIRRGVRRRLRCGREDRSTASATGRTVCVSRRYHLLTVSRLTPRASAIAPWDSPASMRATMDCRA